MNRIRNVVVFSFLICGISIVNADIFSPSHSCVKPYKPYKFKSKREYKAFLDDVESYKSCINDYVQEQNDAIKRHKDGAEDAIDEWNNFVNYELD